MTGRIDHKQKISDVFVSAQHGPFDWLEISLVSVEKRPNAQLLCGASVYLHSSGTFRTGRTCGSDAP